MKSKIAELLPPSIGCGWRIEYPVVNRYDVPLEFVKHKLTVVGIRDFYFLPMDARVFLRSPMERRGRWLVTAIDDETQDVRRFWCEARKGGHLPNRRIGVVDPAKPAELIDWIEQVFPPTLDGTLQMRKTARKWYRIVKERGDIGLKLVVYHGHF